MKRRLSGWTVAVAAVVIGLTSATSASAQVIGTFKWQFAPYCNVVTVQIEQKGPTIFELLGSDDGCDGAAPAATANGSAHLNAGGGTVTLSLALVRPDGFVINNNIQLNPATLGGAWKDDWGNSGTFVFNPPPPVAGNPRRLSMRGDYLIVYPGETGGHQGGASIAFPHQLPVAPIAVAANVRPAGSAPTTNCPGTLADPQAAPGHACVYEFARSTNTVSVVMLNTATNTTNSATPTGFTILVNGNGVGNTFSYGRWAVTVP
jgi:hypothetical protein